MKRILAVLAAFAALTMTGCGASVDVSELGLDVSDIQKAEYAHCAQVKELALSDGDKAALAEWLGGLRIAHRTYPDGGSPGDSDGGEAYTFTFADGELSYIDNGEERFLLFEGEWYALIKHGVFPLKS